MRELNDFYNAGFGWICKQCDAELTDRKSGGSALSRAFLEGEAESKNPELSTEALAKWTDKTRRFLICPRCGITEPAEIS
jgi:hypothetical protein